MCNLTGSHIPQQAIPLAPSFRTNDLVGIHKRLDPTDPGPCHVNVNVSTLLRRRLRKKGVQVVPSQRHGDRSSSGNKQFGVNPPGGADDRFRERQDVIFYRHPH